MSNLVIVAIPDENDRVWKVSSEKKPHLTLLFLGDAEGVANADEIVKFVEHAATLTLSPFYLPVDRRDVLGEDKADVLFFKKGRWGYKEIRDFRVNLLKDSNIRTAYDSAKQFEGPWTPHLTLGYPDTPAKPDDTDRDYGFYDVSFNKIGVWFGDFDGPEFLLKDRWDEWDTMETAPIDVAMADQRDAEAADFMENVLGLEHHGVKGMRWGVRKEETAGGGHIRISNKTNAAGLSNASGAALVGSALFMWPVVPALFLNKRVRSEWKAASAQNKKVQGDKKYKKAIAKSKKAVEVHNAAAAEINKKIPEFNKDKRWAGMTPGSPKQKAYDAAVEKELLNPAYSAAAVKIYGSESPSGRYSFKINNAAEGTLKFTDTLKQQHDEKLKHADDDEEETIEVSFAIKRSPTGHILGFRPQETVEHSAAEEGAEFLVFNGLMDPDTFLEHHGVKGMRWGVRKSDVGGAAKSAAKATGKGALSGAKAVGRGIDNASLHFAKRNSHVIQGITADAHTALKRTDLPAIKEKHGDYGKVVNRAKKPLSPEAKAYRKDVKAAYLQRLEEAANRRTNIQGNRRFTLTKEDGTPNTSKYRWKIRIEKLQHADLEEDTEFTVRPIFDEEGYIVDFEMVADDEMAQALEVGADFLVSTGLMTEEEVLEHFGVKGMRWGVRKEHVQAVGNAAKSTGGALGKAAVATGKFVGDVNFEAKIGPNNAEGTQKVESEIKSKAHEAFRRTDLPAIKDKPEYQEAKKLRNRLRHPRDPATKAYRKEIKEAYISRLEDAANSMKNTSGTRQYTIRERGWETPPEGGALPKSKYYWDVTSREVKHADGSAITWTMEVDLDEDGFVKDIAEVPAKESVAHSIETGAYFLAAMGLIDEGELEHYGVKGMRWGVRRGDRPAPTAVATSSASVVPHGRKRKTKIDVEGGENHDAHEDAIKIAESKAKLKKSGVNALSNKELQDMAKRLQLENQVAVLNSSRANKFIQRQLEQTGQQAVQRNLSIKTAKKVAKKTGKAAATGAVTLALL